MPDKYASMDSQLGYAECEVEDTEEMFWLRELDDYQSMVSLGNALVGQYRFQDAIEVYEKASRIKALREFSMKRLTDFFGEKD